MKLTILGELFLLRKMEEVVEVHINGSERPEVNEGNVLEVLEQLNLPVARVVVEVNGEIVPKNLYDHYWVDKRALVEIVNFVGGG